MNRSDINTRDIIIFDNYPTGIGFTELSEQEQSMLIGNAKYKYSWDWLMPLCKKCRDENFKLTADTERCGKIFRGMILNDIRMAHQGIIEFLEWYNESP